MVVLRADRLVVRDVVLGAEQDLVLLNLVDSGLLDKHVPAFDFDLVHVAADQVVMTLPEVSRIVCITAALDLLTAKTIGVVTEAFRHIAQSAKHVQTVPVLAASQVAVQVLGGLGSPSFDFQQP